MSVRLDAIIPAHNEAATVGAVVSAVLEADVCRAVTVVDDGSTDATADAARSAGAEVLRLDGNRGKAEAMLEGMRRSDAGAIAFFDADLIGLQAAHVELLAEHYRPGVADQVCGLRDYGRFNVLQLLTPVITGERIVKRWVLDRLPLTCWRGYAIETAINFTVDRAGGTTCLVPLRGVTIRNKTDKVGFFEGWRRHLRMAGQMRRAAARLEESDGSSCEP